VLFSALRSPSRNRSVPTRVAHETGEGAKIFVRYFASAPFERFKADVGRYPWTSEGFAVLLHPPADAGSRARWRGPYREAESIPRDPWMRPYQYEFPATRGHRLFEVYSLGLDGVKSADDFFY
jgi:type II secretion system protein G